MQTLSLIYLYKCVIYKCLGSILHQLLLELYYIFDDLFIEKNTLTFFVDPFVVYVLKYSGFVHSD